MKRVVGSLSDVAHIWAHPREPDDHARNGSDSMSFHGRTAYSYAAQIACWHQVHGGDRVALFSSGYVGYSVSTSRHMREFESAWPGLAFTVPYIAPRNSEEHHQNWRYLRSAMNQAILDLRNARMPSRYELERVDRARDTVNRYADTFQLNELVCTGLDGEERALLVERIEAAEAVRNAKARAKRAEYQLLEAQRLAEVELRQLKARRRLFWHKLMPWLIGKPGGMTYGQSTTSKRERRDLVKAWRNGEAIATYRLGVDARSGALLRIKGSKLETSGGIKIPLTEGSKRQLHAVWRLVKAVQSGRLEFDRERNVLMIEAEHTRHRVSSISSEGTLVSGCHTIGFDELSRMAVALGFEVPSLAQRLKGTLTGKAVSL